MKKVMIFLLACLSSTVMLAQELHYTIDWTGCGPDNTKITGVLMIDGEEVYNGEGMEEAGGGLLEMGVFDQDGICRGSKFPTWRSKSNQWIYQLQFRGVVGYSVFHFKIYDHATGTELPLVDDFGVEITYQGNYTYPWNGANSGVSNPFPLNFVTVPSEYTLPITGYGEGEGKWHLISSPVGSVQASAVENLMSNSFDLYSFDQTANLEWINMHDGGTLAAGTGYLYANSADVTLTFTGSAYEGEGTFPLTYSTTNPDATMHGWNLVGNPFAQPASVDHEFYVMNEAGTEIITGSGNVPAMNGIFVKATAENQSVTFTPNGTNTGSKLALNLVRNDRAASLVDRAVVRFDQGGTLPKFMLDPTNTRVYIPQDGEDYAVATCGDDNVMPVSFKAKENGSYTLKVSIDNVEMGYLHLIDNKTGNDIDLLATPSYTFEANSHDYAERFSLVYATTDGLNESFAFFNGSNWIIENGGKALLQVVDVTGRVLRSEQISGNAEIDLGNVAGVYVLRLINGNDTKVQKVVVK